jgi:myo-inositol-1(or 4)-monophosphatase
MPSTLDFTSELAQQAGQRLLDFFRLEGITASLKADKTVVTEADLAADAIITEQIKANYPQDAILSEESQPTIDHLEKAVWVIDPLDGTTNFSLGIPIWGVSIARVVNGEPETAALYFPVLNELYTAQKGEGTFLNGKPVQPNPDTKIQQTSFFTCCTRTHRRYHVTVPYKTRILGAAAYDFAAVARGAALLGFQATPKIWDLAAGWLIVEEAGGVVEALESQKPFPLDPTIDYAAFSFPTIMAANAELTRKAHSQIRPR